tara:strand:- start:136 stop:465 length:330 start_codon:yes stop_codon:yes gene_type:complete
MKIMKMIKGVLLAFTLAFLFVIPHKSDASNNLNLSPSLSYIIKHNLDKIFVHRGGKPHSHPHHAIMEKKIRRKIKKDQSEKNKSKNVTKPLRQEVSPKKKDHSKNARKS